ncbi:hypothetical protein KI387_008669 [Taxus chinensis]|uniref:Uncharacterized protein n=1 Tax=Taxus chinensis TaxID=29808 RepID=A0AA38CPT5_TAXCH|nr:hypothetical protein KI387_008669 [Taxus chinensis]
MFVAIPAALTFYSRSKMLETARFTALVAKNAKQQPRTQSILEGHLHRHQVVACGWQNEHRGGILQGVSGAGKDCGVFDSAGVLVHACLNQPYGQIFHSATRLLLHDGIHVWASYSIRALEGTQRQWLRYTVCAHHLLHQFRSKQHHFYCPRGGVPGEASLDLPQDIGCMGHYQQPIFSSAQVGGVIDLTKWHISDRNFLQFESGYVVETVLEGSKLGIDPYTIEVSPDGELLILDSQNNNILRLTPSLSHCMCP